MTKKEYLEQKKLINELPHDTYWILVTLGLVRDAIPKNKIHKLLNDARVNSKEQTIFTATSINKHLHELIRLDICTEVDTDVKINEQWRIVVPRTAVIKNANRVKALGLAIDSTPKLSESLQFFYYLKERDISKVITKLALCFYLQDEEGYQSILNRLPDVTLDARLMKIMESISDLLLPLDNAFFRKQSPFFQQLVIENIFSDLNKWTDETALDLERLLINHPELYTTNGERYRFYLTHSQLMRGAWIVPFRVRDELQKYPGWAGLLAMKSLAAGKIDDAQEAISRVPHKGMLPNHFFGALYLIYEARLLDAQKMPLLSKQLEAVAESTYPCIFEALQAYFLYQLVDEYEGQQKLHHIVDDKVLSPLEWVVVLWCAYWMNISLSPDQIDIQLKEVRFWQSIGLYWLAGEIANSLALLLPKDHKETKKYASLAKKIKKEQRIHYLSPIVPREEIWERALNALEQVNAAPENHTNAQIGSYRLAWFVNFEQKAVIPKEQKLTKNGTWSSGRKIGLTKILEGNLDSITDQDRSLKDALYSIYHEQVYPYYQYSDDDLILDFEHALYLLRGHPFLFIAGKQQLNLSIIEAQPELFITDEEAGLKVYFKPLADREGFQLEKETSTRYKIYKLSKNQVKISRAIGRGIHIPTEARQRLEAVALELRTQVSVQSTAQLLDEHLPEVAGSPRPCFQLIPYHKGYKLELFVKPLHPEPHYFKPGEGLTKIVLSTQNGRIALYRDLQDELQQADTIIDACPVFKQLDNENYEWLLDNDQQCLQLLYELRPYWEEERIVLEHPKGERIRLTNVSSSKDFSMRIRKERDWFAVDGQLEVDEQTVINFRQILEHIRGSDSPFIQLKDGEYLALTEQLQQRLMDIDSLIHQKGHHLQLSGLAILQMDSIAHEIKELETDIAWKESLKRIHRAQSITPVIPANFKAALRDYQKEGYHWLMRLAEWGVGACLADDMGLGKTIQALVMLNARSHHGPSLVIAPASVTRNWLRETERFAPALNAKLLATSKELSMLKELESGDVLLISYGLLPFIEEELSAIPFANLVLDEAQAIKNAATKRSKTVKKIQADFRLATTGTPIENHLGELWNLFHFLNPGLLGSRKAFADKFAKPITRDNDELRREQLRRLIRPFILRRRKEEVLTELPPKTEVTLTVELSDKERAFYEALRQNALSEIDAAEGNAKRFTILAQLTRLRQAACHPLLVKTNSRIPSSKLQLVGETILEILDNGHKALVFSQFVKHLRLVEQWVKNEGIPYQYLDGQTPGKKRESAVNAFQNGEGQLFLISLKAGGTGLNLTEADYVLHLDPWWNPAVENQASDRAHRIGQQRPVTVYRFVSEQTIEEKIVALHQEKQALADELLSGTDASARLSVEDMLDLLR